MARLVQAQTVPEACFVPVVGSVTVKPLGLKRLVVLYAEHESTLSGGAALGSLRDQQLAQDFWHGHRSP